MISRVKKVEKTLKTKERQVDTRGIYCTFVIRMRHTYTYSPSGNVGIEYMREYIFWYF